jgi:hypothetical protein
MKLRYFIVDHCHQLRKTTQSAILGLWEGRRKADALGVPVGNELRLVSVLCDEKLIPEKVYLLRLPLTQGRFTQEDYLTLQVFTRRDCVTAREVIQHHTDGWPPDFYKQLAVLLDVPLAHLNVPLGVGGPLFMAAAMRVTPTQAIRYLR